jgi:hypothetical protein
MTYLLAAPPHFDCNFSQLSAGFFKELPDSHWATTLQADNHKFTLQPVLAIHKSTRMMDEFP